MNIWPVRCRLASRPSDLRAGIAELSPNSALQRRLQPEAKWSKSMRLTTHDADTASSTSGSIFWVANWRLSMGVHADKLGMKLVAVEPQAA